MNKNENISPFDVICPSSSRLYVYHLQGEYIMIHQHSLSREQDTRNLLIEIKHCLRTKNWRRLRQMLKSSQAFATLNMAQNNESIHFACKQDAPYDIVQTLLKIEPNGAARPDERGRLPLHYAVANTRQIGVILMLLREFKPGVEHCDNEGKLPLHLACEAHSIEHSEFSRQLIEILLSSYHDAVYVADMYGNLPCTYFTFSDRKRIPSSDIDTKDVELKSVLLNDLPEDTKGRHRKVYSGSFHWWLSDFLVVEPVSERKNQRTARQA